MESLFGWIWGEGLAALPMPSVWIAPEADVLSRPQS